MNIVVAGGSGFIGRPLCHALIQEGHQVTVLSRNPREAGCLLDPRTTVVGWDASTSGVWEHAIERADAVINLAGEPIGDKRWTADRKRALRDSRLNATRLLVQALIGFSGRARTFILASGVGYYGPRDSTPVTERSPAGSGFLADLSSDCEREAVQAEAHGVRVVRLRIGIVLENDGGALPRMALPFRFFAGGPILPGDQWISWIHRQDLIGLLQWILRTPAIVGPLNCVAPGAVTMNEFCRSIGRVLGRPAWLPVPRLVLHLAFGELATVLTTGQRVEPAVALREGYVFAYPSLEPALREIFGKPRRAAGF